MKKPGVSVTIPGLGERKISALISDYTGTLSLDGQLSARVREALKQIAGKLDVHIITADTFSRAEPELKGLPLEIHKLQGPGSDHDLQKLQFLGRFTTQSVVALGNGNNDRLLLKAVKEGRGLAIAVDNGEGCATDSIQSANVFISGACNALDLLLKTDRLKATLRF